MVEGLGQVEIKQFMDLIIKANSIQIKAMLTTLQGELKKRELQTSPNMMPNSKVKQ